MLELTTNHHHLSAHLAYNSAFESCNSLFEDIDSWKKEKSKLSHLWKVRWIDENFTSLQAEQGAQS